MNYQFRSCDHWNAISEQTYRALAAAGYGPDKLRIAPEAEGATPPVTKEQALDSIDALEGVIGRSTHSGEVLRRFIEEQP